MICVDAVECTCYMNQNQLAESGSIEIVIPSDGTLYVGVGSNANVAHGGFVAACFDGDYIKIKKAR